MYNNEVSCTIHNYVYIDIIDNQIIRRPSNFYSQNPYFLSNESCVFIGTGISIDNLDINIPDYSTIFFLCSKYVDKYKIFSRWISLLEMYPGNKSYFLLDEDVSEEILMMIFTRSDILIKYNKKTMTPYTQKITVSICLIMICFCIISIFYLVCGIYSSSNPIITEFELERFNVVKFKDLKEKASDSCLICFDTYEDTDDVRILFCNHYFHKKCVDKWLCEQSSRCPYCRYTNKYYAEI
ncbi:hypothetical protein P3W45_001016 [Vairimorpha bombi]